MHGRGTFHTNSAYHFRFVYGRTKGVVGDKELGLPALSLLHLGHMEHLRAVELHDVGSLIPRMVVVVVVVVGMAVV